MFRVFIIPVQGHVIDIVVALVQHGQLPVAEGLDHRTGGTAYDQLDTGVNQLHDFGGFSGQAAVFLSALLPLSLIHI